MRERLLHLAAQLDQLNRELDAVGVSKEISFAASHSVGVIQSLLRAASRRIQQIAGGLN